MTTRLKDNFKKGMPIASISHDWLNTVARWLNSINVNGGPRFATPFDLRLFLSSGLPLEPWHLNYSLDGGEVTLTAGYVFWGLLTMDVSESGPNAVADGDCWGIEVTYSDGAWGAAWVKKSLMIGFVDTEEIMRRFYYKFSVANGIASIAEIGARGSWKIPSTFAPET